jgi:hypothetical protein
MQRCSYHRQHHQVADNNVSSRNHLLLAITSDRGFFCNESLDGFHDPRGMKINNGIEGGRDVDNEHLIYRQVKVVAIFEVI